VDAKYLLEDLKHYTDLEKMEKRGLAPFYGMSKLEMRSLFSYYFSIFLRKKDA
jgi:hypothetical protein